MTVAAFMDLALYHPDAGYYARAAQRSGRAGDFFTSVDVGPLFGELLAIQIKEMFTVLADLKVRTSDVVQAFRPAVDLVEAGAGNGRLMADILRAIRRTDPVLYDSIRAHLVEGSAVARLAQRATLDDVADRLRTSDAALPGSFDGVLIANELIDALPVHQVVMRDGGLREIYVDVRDGQFVTREGPPSTPALAAYLDRLGVALEPGWRVEINLRAVDWMRDAATRLGRGFIVLIDYGHSARELYSATHAGGTLTTFRRHTASGAEDATPSWLRDAGDQDITAHVDFTTLQQTAEAAGLSTIGFLDQGYFLLGLVGSQGARGAIDSNVVNPVHPLNFENLANRLAFKTLMMPGGLGSTHKVLILGKGVGTPALAGCSFKVRVT